MNYKRLLLIEKKNHFCLYEHLEESLINELSKEINKLIAEEVLKINKNE
jgi:hypothetical protein